MLFKEEKKNYFDVGIDLSCCSLFDICLSLARKNLVRLFLLPKHQINSLSWGPCENHWTNCLFFSFCNLLFSLWLADFLVKLAERETFVKTKWWLASSVSLDICFLKKDLWQLCLYLLCTNRWYIYTYIVYICFTISTVLYELSLFFCLNLSFSYDNLLWSGDSVT